MTQKDKEKCLDEIRNGKEFFDFYSERKDMSDVVNYFEKYYYGKIKKMITLFELDEKDWMILKEYRIKPRTLYGKLISFTITILGYKNVRKLFIGFKKLDIK